jgi:hypothetical protein
MSPNNRIQNTRVAITRTFFSFTETEQLQRYGMLVLAVRSVSAFYSLCLLLQPNTIRPDNGIEEHVTVFQKLQNCIGAVALVVMTEDRP